MKYKIILGLLFALIFQGCNDFYIKIYDNNEIKKEIDCFKITSDNLIVKEIVLKNSFLKKLAKDNCQTTLKITSNFLTSCSSVKAKAFGSDFDGYIRFDIIRDGKLIYRIQRDFKGALTKEIVKKIVNKMKKDLNFGKI